ncbi:hypothetical protein B0H11DRAFT_1918287 [Mycena galericulata]|nr:hypothetical protein B0H11DRAFT_1918287 [Mycena galericulata]
MGPPVTTLMRFPRPSSRAGQHVDDQPPTPFSNANTNAPPQHAHTQEPHAVRAHPLDALMRATSRMAVPAILKKWLHSVVFADNAYSMLTGGNCVFVLARADQIIVKLHELPCCYLVATESLCQIYWALPGFSGAATGFSHRGDLSTQLP